MAFRKLASLAVSLGAIALGLVAPGCATAHKAPESVEILSRTELAPEVSVKHILIAWSWLAPTYRQAGLTLDRRAEDRVQSAAETLANELLARVRAGESIEALMKQYSEDEGSAQSGIAYRVTPESHMADAFIELSLRLQTGESGIVRSKFGFHVIKRVK